MDTSPQAQQALAALEEKLDHFLTEEAKAVDPALKFNLKKEIEDVRARIDKLRRSGTPTDQDAPRSPFVVGLPIEKDDDFFGRHKQRELLVDAIEQGQSVQILGERRMGKTSFLKWVGRQAPRWQERPVAWVNAQGLDGRSPAALVGAIATALKRRAAGGDPAQALDVLLPAVLLVDEADALAKPGHGFDDGFLDILRAFCQEGNLVWVSASYRNLHQLFTHTGLTSSFLNDARQTSIGQLEEDAVRSLIARLEDDSLESLAVEHGAGFAYGLQWLGDALWRSAPERDAVLHDFASVMEEQCFRRWWEALNDNEQTLLRRCLDGLDRDKLEKIEARSARRLERRGLLAAKDGVLSVPGKVWRDFVESA